MEAAEKTAEFPAESAIHPDGVEEQKDEKGNVVKTFVWFGGRQYEVGDLERDDVIACRERLHERMEDPIEAVAPALEALANDESLSDYSPAVREAMKKELMDRAYRDLTRKKEDRVPAPEDVASWIDNTESGAAYTMYLMMRRTSPDITEETALAITKMLGKDNWIRRRDERAKKLKEQAKKRRK